MFSRRKAYRATLRLQEQINDNLRTKLEQTNSILVEIERDLHEAKHSVKHWKDKYKDLEHEYDKLKKRKKK